MKKKYWLIIFLFLLFVFAIIGRMVFGNIDFFDNKSSELIEDIALSKSLLGSSASSLLDLEDRSIIELKIGDRIFLTEVVNSAESRQSGLSGRQAIGGDNKNVKAMLFVFPEKARHVFWMKDMSFDIDIIWIANNEVIGIDKEVPSQPGVADSLLTRYIPPQSVDLVLELESGVIGDIEVGDEVVRN